MTTPRTAPRPSRRTGLLSKTRWGAFTGSTLDQTLRDLRVTQIVVTGINTQIGVETTARTGYELGYHVVLVTDAMTCGDRVAHEHSVRHVFPRLGETGTTDEVLGLLARSR
jgi:nicotinamidase-related amidase